MKSSLLIAAILVLSLAPAAWAGTNPHLNTGDLTAPNTSTDIISTTSGSGTIHGIHCQFDAQAPVAINFFINGGSAQTIVIDPGVYPADSAGNSFSGWIPYDIPFTTSIRVQMQRALSPVVYGETPCTVSWTL